jgi:hypothetical protein
MCPRTYLRGHVVCQLTQTYDTTVQTGRLHLSSYIAAKFGRKIEVFSEFFVLVSALAFDTFIVLAPFCLVCVVLSFGRSLAPPRS